MTDAYETLAPPALNLIWKIRHILLDNILNFSFRAQFFGEAGKLIPRPMSIKEELTDQTVCQPEWSADWMACRLTCRLSGVQTKTHAVSMVCRLYWSCRSRLNQVLADQMVCQPNQVLAEWSIDWIVCRLNGGQTEQACPWRLTFTHICNTFKTRYMVCWVIVSLKF